MVLTVIFILEEKIVNVVGKFKVLFFPRLYRGKEKKVSINLSLKCVIIVCATRGSFSAILKAHNLDNFICIETNNKSKCRAFFDL